MILDVGREHEQRQRALAAIPALAGAVMCGSMFVSSRYPQPPGSPPISRETRPRPSARPG